MTTSLKSSVCALAVVAMAALTAHVDAQDRPRKIVLVDGGFVVGQVVVDIPGEPVTVIVAGNALQLERARIDHIEGGEAPEAAEVRAAPPAAEPMVSAAPPALPAPPVEAPAPQEEPTPAYVPVDVLAHTGFISGSDWTGTYPSLGATVAAGKQFKRDTWQLAFGASGAPGLGPRLFAGVAIRSEVGRRGFLRALLGVAPWFVEGRRITSAEVRVEGAFRVPGQVALGAGLMAIVHGSGHVFIGPYLCAGFGAGPRRRAP